MSFFENSQISHAIPKLLAVSMARVFLYVAGKVAVVENLIARKCSFVLEPPSGKGIRIHRLRMICGISAKQI